MPRDPWHCQMIVFISLIPWNDIADEICNAFECTGQENVVRTKSVESYVEYEARDP